MIYKGSQKEGRVYKGSTKIGKIYKGSQLIYQSGLKLYVAEYQNLNDTNYINGLIGFWSTSGYVMGTGGVVAITAISGTLGTNGSYVYYDPNYPHVYISTITMNNKQYYVYKDNGWGLTVIIVEEGSVVGNYALYTITINASTGTTHPTSVSSNSYTYTTSGGSSQTVTKSSNDVLTFTKTGGLS